MSSEFKLFIASTGI